MLLNTLTASNALSVQVHYEADASLASSWNCRHWATGLGGRHRRRRTPDGRACCDDVVVRRDGGGLEDRSRYCHTVCSITAKVISRFHWNLVLWLDLPIGRTD